MSRWCYVVILPKGLFHMGSNICKQWKCVYCQCKASWRSASQHKDRSFCDLVSKYNIWMLHTLQWMRWHHDVRQTVDRSWSSYLQPKQKSTACKWKVKQFTYEGELIKILDLKLFILGIWKTKFINLVDHPRYRSFFPMWVLKINYRSVIKSPKELFTWFDKNQILVP